MPILAKKLSFSRRRQLDHKEKPRTPSPSTSQDSSDNFATEVDDRALEPLKGLLLKRHQSKGVFSWGKRYFEVDDFLGLLLYYRTFKDMVREYPAD